MRQVLRFKSAILFVALMVLVGCSAQQKRPQQQEPKPPEQKEEKRPLFLEYLDIAQVRD